MRQALLSDAMKTIPLRQLLREPLKVKRLTRSGQAVRVTDQGAPLWIIQPAAGEDDAGRAHAIDELLDEVLRGPKSSISLSRLIKDSRR